jgi:hypothetical protein
MAISLGLVVSRLIDGKDTKVPKEFYKLECKKYLIKRNIND